MKLYVVKTNQNPTDDMLQTYMVTKQEIVYKTMALHSTQTQT